MKLIHYLFFILLGVIIYKYIQNIEGLTCFTPFHDVLGDDTTQYGQVNKGSYPVLLKDNLVLQAPATAAAPAAALDFPAPGSQESRDQTFNDTNTLNVVCDPGDATFPPWQLSGGADKVLTCKNPTHRVIIQAHGGFTFTHEMPTTDFYGTRTDIRELMGFRVFKRMQMLTYLNRGDCMNYNTLNTGWTGLLYKILTDDEITLEDFKKVYMDTIITELSKPGAIRLNPEEIDSRVERYYPDRIRDFFAKGYSELTRFDRYFFLSGERDDSIYIDFNIKQGKLWSDVTEPYEIPLLDVTLTVNRCSVTTPNDISGAHLPQQAVTWYRIAFRIYAAIRDLLNMNVFSILGPFYNRTCIIMINTPEMLNILTTPNVLSNTFDELFTLTKSETQSGYVITISCDAGTISSIRSSIFALLEISSIIINLDLLSAAFKTDADRLNRLFPGGIQSVPLPLFFLDVLMNPMFVNPSSTNLGDSYFPYRLPGGEYTSFDMIDVIFDIIVQIKTNSGGYNDMYREILKQMGMNPGEIDQFISSLALLILRNPSIYEGTTNGIDKDPPVILTNLRDLWLPWGYNFDNLKANISRYPSIQISGDVIFMLLQLFKQNRQNDYNKLDVHMLTCFQTGSDRDLNRRDSTMDYSWEYTWDDAEIATNGNPLARKIGPTCDKKSCEETKDQINAKLVAQGKGDFEVDDASYRAKIASGIHPTYETKTYRRDAQNNITMNQGQDQSTKIKVNCKDVPNRNTVIECKYNQGPPATFNYDESINALDPRICHDSEALDLSVEVAEVDVVEAVCSVKQAQCVPQQLAGGLRLDFKC
jgi:hypothetical protein